MSATTSPRSQRPFFYGWWLVTTASMQGFIHVGGAVFTAGVFLIPMRDDVGWSSAVVFGALSFRLLVGGMAGAALGPLAERRWAPRLIMPAGAVLMALSFLMVRWAQSPFDFFLWYGIVGAAGLALASPVVLEAIVVKWFVRRRASAMMWLQVGPPVGPLLFPVMLTGLIAWLGWRDAWFWTGLGMLALLLPLTFTVRSRPEDVGLLPDGDDAPPAPTAADARPAGAVRFTTGFTPREVLRTRAFWLLTAAAFVGMFGFPGYQAHWVPYFREIGFDAPTAAFGVFLFGVFSVASRFVWGYLSARVAIRPLFAVQSVLAAGGVVLMLAVRGEPMLVVWAVAQGMTMGAFFQLQAIMAPAYFGREHIGAIRGMMWMPMNVSAGAAPLIVGWLHDWRGDYTVGFMLVLALWLLTALLVALSRPPERQGRTVAAA